MPKLTEYPEAQSFDENDILIKDGVNGTKKIKASNAADYMGKNVIMVNEDPTPGTKVVLETTDEEYELALMSDVNSVAEEVDDVKTQVTQIGAAIGEYTSIPTLTLGDVSVGNDGTATYKVRDYGVITPENSYCHFVEGTKLSLSSYSAAKFYVALKLDSGKFDAPSSWTTGGVYIIPKTGDYILNIQSVPTTTQSSINALYNLLSVVAPSATSRIDELYNTLGGTTYIPSLILGDLSISADGTATYKVRDYGVITPSGSYCYFIQGTELSLSSYSAAKFGCARKISNNKFEAYGWTTSGSFIVPQSGEYTLNIQSEPTTTQTSIDALYNLFVVKSPTVTERIDNLSNDIAILFPTQFGLSGIKVLETIANSWPQGVALMGERVCAFYASNDAHTNHADIKVYNVSDLTTQIGKFEHNLGHCGTGDYNADADILLVANGNYPAPENPTVYLISGASEIAYNSLIEYDDDNVTAIEMTSVTSQAIGACFGETADIVFVVSMSDNYDVDTTKTIYKLQIGYGTNNMVSLFPSASVGSYTAQSDGVPNGTAKIMATYTVDFPGEMQGLKYLNGRLIFSMDSRVPTGIKTPYIVSVGIYKNIAIVDKTYWIPSLNKNGTQLAVEAEGLFFDGVYGYVDVGATMIYKFLATQL